MKIHEIYFSPTGGTKKVADILTSAICHDCQQTDLTLPEWNGSDTAFAPDDCAIIAVPSFGGRVPTLAAQRIASLNGADSRAVVVCVYGNRAYEDTLVELQDLATGAGFKVIAAVAAIAEHSIAHVYATGRPDEQDIEELTDMAQVIKEKLAEGIDVQPQIPGNRPYKNGMGASMPPLPTADCNRCGLCAAQCPVHAIDKCDVAKVDSAACIMCMKCVAVCPQSARRINPNMEAALIEHLRPLCTERKSNELFC